MDAGAAVQSQIRYVPVLRSVGYKAVGIDPEAPEVPGTGGIRGL
jgi:hypothetical protein